MTNPSAKKQLANVRQGVVEDLMAMSESEIDAELRELGIEPSTAAAKGAAAVGQGVSKARAQKRDALRAQMDAARNKPQALRDASITPEVARQRIAELQTANDSKFTLAARNRNPLDLTDQEALELFWKIEELKQ